MKKRKKVLVVLGGLSREREVSLKSGRACIKAIKKLGHYVKTLDPKKKPLNQINKNKIDIIFNALHGKYGEDGIAQSNFEYLRIPYTHSGVISSMNSMDKIISKNIFISNRILTPRFLHLNLNDNVNLIKSKIARKKFKLPIVLKPIREGSSIDVNICFNYSRILSVLKSLSKNYKEILCEEFIGGQEIQVAVINKKAIGSIELKPKRKFYDYKAKYSKSAKTTHIMPANLSKKNYRKVMKIAERVHKIMGCRGVTRSDFKFYKNKFYLLEINTQPGMTSLSLVPEIAKYYNISFESLINKILSDAGLHK